MTLNTSAIADNKEGPKTIGAFFYFRFLKFYYYLIIIGKVALF
ncbi:MAG: hypothetical protein UU71_C0004G0019 [Parcubacteria group bacterium GW2011_GWB1_41_6]|nr:MAG: hypothetical protein UU71_C0004G0019 [Parcubacteria group bacterium GW2011_GWB1_41_6]KKS33940.1 MAG: hypothetical protein UU96_C0011G0018 [Parcubacteria group bacterium GW2011_GWC2_42_13]